MHLVAVVVVVAVVVGMTSVDRVAHDVTRCVAVSMRIVAVYVVMSIAAVRCVIATVCVCTEGKLGHVQRYARVWGQ